MDTLPLLLHQLQKQLNTTNQENHQNLRKKTLYLLQEQLPH
jgi:hypothetical protein